MQVPRTVRDFGRIFALMAVASVLLWVSTYHMPDPALGPILTSSAILLYIVAFSHFTRRVVLISVDTRKFLAAALEGNVAAGLVVCGIFYVFVSLVQAGVSLLR